MKPFLVFLMAFMAITTSEAMSLGGNKDESEQNTEAGEDDSADWMQYLNANRFSIRIRNCFIVKQLLSYRKLNCDEPILCYDIQFQKVSFDEVCLELKTVKSELSKVWEMLEIKVIFFTCTYIRVYI